MNRSRKSESAKLTRRLIVRLSDEDRGRLSCNARRAGLTVSEYVRRMAVDGQVVVRRESGYSFAMTNQLRRIGVNINQQMAIAHTNGEIPAPLVRLWTKLDALLDRIIQTE